LAVLVNVSVTQQPEKVAGMTWVQLLVWSDYLFPNY